jgi:hypothetical protein
MRGSGEVAGEESKRWSATSTAKNETASQTTGIGAARILGVCALEELGTGHILTKAGEKARNRFVVYERRSGEL